MVLIGTSAGDAAAMHPLTPDDLLIRHSPVDNDRWLDGKRDESEPSIPSSVPLERFQTLEHVIRDTPLHVDPYLELARIYLQNSRWVDAKRVLDLAVERFPEDEEVNYLREEAQIARSLQLLSEARKEFEEEPTKLTKENLDRCNVELNVLRESVCRSRLKRHPDQVELNMPLATALENLGNREEAIACLQRAVAEPNLRGLAALQLGQTYERSGKVPQALSAYRRAALFRVPPPSDDVKLRALTAAANLATNSGMIDSARRYVEMLSEMQPNNAAIQTRLEELRKSEL